MKRVFLSLWLFAMALAIAACGPSPESAPAAASGAGDSANTASTQSDPRRRMPADEGLKAKYIQSCYSCHSGGVNGAPRSGVWSEWQPRFSQGMDVLVSNTRHGIRAMPPKGMCVNCSDEDYRALILFMANPPETP